MKIGTNHSKIKRWAILEWKVGRTKKVSDTWTKTHLHMSLEGYLNWHELWKQEKWPRGIFHKAQWAWQGVKLTRLMSIFTSKKVWKFLIKIQLTKSGPKRTTVELRDSILAEMRICCVGSPAIFIVANLRKMPSRIG